MTITRDLAIEPTVDAAILADRAGRYLATYGALTPIQAIRAAYADRIGEPLSAPTRVTAPADLTSHALAILAGRSAEPGGALGVGTLAILAA